ncbi:MAG: ABC transporter permease, partial [Acidobacteria bacterium]|nr:ABC transporter permease [Acidobacteriota bacterium]
MLQYATRRILLAVPVIFGILIVTFLLARAIPGDPCKSILGERATAAACEAFAENKGLNEPIPTQLAIYIKDVATGDFGESIRFKRSVAQIMVERFPMTIELSLTALGIALVVGIPLGIVSAMKHNTGVDVGAMIF